MWRRSAPSRTVYSDPDAVHGEGPFPRRAEWLELLPYEASMSGERRCGSLAWGGVRLDHRADLLRG